MDGNTEGRRLRKKRRPFPLASVAKDQLVFKIHLAMVSRSMFCTMALKASFNSEPVAAS